MTRIHLNKPLSELAQLRVRLNPDVMAHRVGKDIVLVHLGSNQIFELSGSAVRLWELLRDGVELTVARDQLMAEFEIEVERLERDMKATLIILANLHLAEISR